MIYFRPINNSLMPFTPTYSPVPHVPAPHLRDADGFLRQAPRRSAEYAATHPVQPLKGLPGTRATDVSYRALAPGGAGDDGARTTVHCSLITVHWSFTFSAKEKDVETGLSYFGSRYYSSDLSIWLSVDPMAAKYPSQSPYVYCADNPIKLVDPNGEEIYVEIDGVKYTYNGNGLVGKDGCEFIPKANSFGGRVLKDLNALKHSKSQLIRGKMDDLITSKHSHTIKLASDETEFNQTLDKANASTPGEGSGTVTYYNPFSTKNNCVDGDRLSCAVLTHELLGHGWDKDQGMYDANNKTSNGIRYEEINAINLQNIVLKEHNLQTRTAIGHDENTKKLIPESELNKYFTPKPPRK